MHILYIHQYFKTPNESAATRSFWFAKKLVAEGHKVTMLTSTNNKLHKEPQRLFIEGIEVIYIKNEYNQSMTKLQKVYSFVRFFLLSIAKSYSIKNIDLVFATSTPLTVGAIALYLRQFRRLNYIFEVRDLWPEFPIQIGAIRNSWLIAILRKLEKKIYKKASHIIALSPGMKNGVLECGINEDKITMIPNMSKPDLFYPREKNKKTLEKYTIDTNKLNIVHFGSMGVANGLEYLIDTAKHLKRNKNICFYLVGDGATLPLLKNKVKEYNLENVFFPGYMDLYEMSDFVNCCDLSVVSFKDLPILYTNSPNKLFDSLSAGKVVVVNSAGWTKDLVENYNCGFYVNPNESRDFASKLEIIDKYATSFIEMGENARRISIDIYDKKILSKQFVKVVEQVFHNVNKIS